MFTEKKHSKTVLTLNAQKTKLQELRTQLSNHLIFEAKISN